jgi:hypothetical protein
MSQRSFGSFILSLVFGPPAKPPSVPFIAARHFKPGDTFLCTDPEFLTQTNIDIDPNGVWEVIRPNGEHYNYGPMYDVKAPDGSEYLLLGTDLSRFFVAVPPPRPAQSPITPDQGPSS